MKITKYLLTKHRACRRQVKKFAALFPDGVEPTRELCLAHATSFDWNWAAKELLSYSTWRAYDEDTAPARKAYDEAIAPAWYDAWSRDNENN